MARGVADGEDPGRLGGTIRGVVVCTGAVTVGVGVGVGVGVRVGVGEGRGAGEERGAGVSGGGPITCGVGVGAGCRRKSVTWPAAGVASMAAAAARRDACFLIFVRSPRMAGAG